MAWNFTETELGAVDEYVPFSHSVTYTDDVTGQSYSVILQPQEEQPPTVYISGNNITGYYSYVFNIEVTYKTLKDKFVVVNNFRDIDYDQLHEVIKYVPDLQPGKTYNYTAIAIDANKVPVATTNYTKFVNNNWDLNRNLLIQYVNSTVITDPALFRPWINSINNATVKWRNSSNIEINWA